MTNFSTKPDIVDKSSWLQEAFTKPSNDNDELPHMNNNKENGNFALQGKKTTNDSLRHKSNYLELTA